MELFIQIKDGAPFEHPIFGDNFRQAFPDVDTEKLPPEFARFERVQPPSVGVYEVYEGVAYELIDGVYKDVHRVRALTEQEKQAKIAEALSQPHPSDWVFSEEYCAWIPPAENTDALGSEPNVIG